MEEDTSGKERDRRIKTLKENAQRYVAELALPALQKTFAKKLRGDWKLFLDAKDPDQQTILFYYPKIFGQNNFAVTEYIKPAVNPLALSIKTKVFQCLLKNLVG